MPNFNESRGYKMKLKGFTTEVPGDTKNEIKIKTDSSKLYGVHLEGYEPPVSEGDKNKSPMEMCGCGKKKCNC
mgnify:FL=1|jgi:hypothetical protein|tara:strand:- start:800 stop:1018 length:219 start_codon:yes stop_codon:yes gene_type:complete